MGLVGMLRRWSRVAWTRFVSLGVAEVERHRRIAVLVTLCLATVLLLVGCSFDRWSLSPPAAVDGSRSSPTPKPVVGGPIAPLSRTSTQSETRSSKPSVVASSTPVASLSLRGFENGRWLERSDRELASAIKELRWTQGYISDTESKAIQRLLYIAVTSRSVASSIVSFGWIRDGVDKTEGEALRWIDNIGSAEVASSVVSLDWVQDWIGAEEVRTIQELSYVANRHAEVASSIVSLDWVQDGVIDVEVEAIDWMNNIRSAEAASSVVSLGWVEDGIEADEVMAIEELSYLANRSAEVGSSVVSLGWVQDGLDETEVALIEAFDSIAYRNAGAALRISEMPFVETIEPPDASAMASLRRLAAFEQEAFERVMSHSALRDGISDGMAPIVATLHGVAKVSPGLMYILLDPGKVVIERRSITLPLTGEVVLDIIRTTRGASRSMDLLEHSVRGAEEYMGLPLPTRYVGLLYEDAVYGSNAGTNFGTHIALLPKFDVDDGSREAEVVGISIAHEVAHYYWSGNEDWVDEGAAELMASVIERVRTGRPIGATNAPCAYADTIAEVEALGVGRDDVEFECNYSLGERLFVDLRRTLGDERFRQGFRALYLVSEMEDGMDDRRGTSAGIEHVRQAFYWEDGDEREVIARWYDGTEPYYLSGLDTGPVDASLNSISGRIDEAYVSTSKDGAAVSGFSARDMSGWVYLTLKYSYDVSGESREVPLEIVEYYEDGIEFNRRRLNVIAKSRYTGGTSWLSVGTSPQQKWAPGRYRVYVYAGERKVAQVQYEVVP